MMYLKQSTVVTVKIGPFIDEDDGKTAETGLTIAQADVRLSKNGGDIAQKTEATSCTHDELGIYACPLDATDTATLGILQLWVHESGALPVWHEYMVVVAHWYDTMCSTDYLQVDAIQIESTDATTQLESAVDAGLDNAVPGSPTAHSINERVKAIDELTEASGDGDLKAILDDTDELQSDDIPAAISGLNNITAANVWAVATRVLTAGTNIALAKGTGVTGFTDLSAANVNTEVVDALATDTYAEPGQGAPAATASLSYKIGLLYKALRNKLLSTDSQISLYNDAGDVVDQKAAVSEDTVTYTRGEMGSGP